MNVKHLSAKSCHADHLPDDLQMLRFVQMAIGIFKQKIESLPWGIVVVPHECKYVMKDKHKKEK